uniref:Uncharacterized protein n=1 Tax=Rhizophora mucronata TaxID=61149 RepID=A0A2P2QAU6_RHIMU
MSLYTLVFTFISVFTKSRSIECNMSCRKSIGTIGYTWFCP